MRWVQLNLGSYTAAPWLFTTLNKSGNVQDYTRWLDLDAGIARSLWNVNDSILSRYTHYLSRGV